MCTCESVIFSVKSCCFWFLLLATVTESIAISSKQVREVLRSELSTSVPVTSASSAMETTTVNYSQAAPLCQRLRDVEQKQQLATEVPSHESVPQPGTSFVIHPFKFMYMYLTRFLNSNINVLYFFQSLSSLQLEVNHET